MKAIAASTEICAGRFPRLFAPLLAGAALLVGPAIASAQDQSPKLATAEIGTVMPAYVDGVVELRRFWTACAKDPADWDKGAAILVGSAEAAGLDGASAQDLRARLAASGGETKYDCSGPVATARLEVPRPLDWPAFHAGVLERVGLKVIVPDAPEDARLARLRSVFADFVPRQKPALNCTALVQVEWFPQTYADWEFVLDKAETSIAAAGFDAETVRSVIGPARAANLMDTIPAAGRQDAIAACVADTRWMDWLGSLSWYSLPSEVEKALGAAQ